MAPGGVNANRQPDSPTDSTFPVELDDFVAALRRLASEWHIERDPGLGWAPFDCNSLTVIDDEEPAYFAG